MLIIFKNFQKILNSNFIEIFFDFLLFRNLFSKKKKK